MKKLNNKTEMQKLNISNSVNVVLQSKGGAGKSVVSFLLANYLKSRLDNVQLVDTDPNNSTFSSYKGLEVKTINILKKIGKEKFIDQSKFDELMEGFVENYGAGLVDTGSGDFIYFNSYMLSNSIPRILKQCDKNLIFHVPINYGTSQNETMACLFDLLENYPDTPIVIWGNQYYEVPNDAVDLELLNKNTAGNAIAVINIRKRNAETHEADFKQLLTLGQTFDEAKTSGDFNMFKLNRLSEISFDIFDQLDQIFTLDEVDPRLEPEKIEIQ